MSYIFPGLVIGAVYAILGNSITLTYSATGVLNLATGSMAFVVADTFYYLIEVVHWPLWAAGILSVGVVSPLLGLLLWGVVFRRMEKSDFVVQVVATIGIAVALPALVQIALPTGQIGQAPGIVPNGLYLVHFWFISATRDQLAAVCGAVLCVILLVLLVDRTRLGLQTRAVVDRPLLAEGRGINTSVVSAASWVLAGLLIGIGAVLLSPLISLDSGQYTELVVIALSVALVGRFRNLIATAVSGLLLGVATSLLIGYAPQGNTLIQGLAPSLPFFLLTILLLLGWSPVTTRRDTVQAQANKRLGRRVRPVTARAGSGAAVADGSGARRRIGRHGGRADGRCFWPEMVRTPALPAATPAVRLQGHPHGRAAPRRPVRLHRLLDGGHRCRPGLRRHLLELHDRHG